MVNYENPSYKCMRIAKEESLAELLEMRRWDVAKRLKEVKLGEGSHENLSDIASVIYEPKFGWTREACDYLRNQLMELIGGERDAQRGCSCGADTCVYHDMQEEVGDGIPGGDCGVREVRRDRDLRDMGDCHFSKEALMTYDVLGNERHKAVCGLRKLDLHSNSVTKNQMAIANALGVDFDGSDLFSDAMRRRLIHLLGGDEIVRNAENDENGDFCELNHLTITDELREWASTEVPYKYGHRLHAIADRIDEQFARICEQQEKVLQETIDGMADELDTLRSRNVAVYAHDNANMYLDLLRDAARDYKELYDFAKSIGENVDEQEIVTLFGVDYVPYFHVEFLGNILSNATRKWAKADTECRMYRDLLNDEAREYVRHKKATDSMYASFNEVFEAIERLL